MKTIEFAKRWRRRTNETTVEEYPAGSKVSVSDKVAKAAFDAGVLKGEPVEAPKTADAPGETTQKS